MLSCPPFHAIPAGELGPDSAAAVWYASGAQADAALSALSNTVLMAAEGTRQLELKAFKGPPGRYGATRAAGPWPGPNATQGLPAGIQGAAAAGLTYQQHHTPQQHQAQHSMAVMQQGGFAGIAGLQQQQGMLSSDQGSAQMWIGSSGGGGVSVSAPGPPGLNMGGAGNQLAALVAATVGMSAASNPYNMQQLLYMLPQQQQQQQMAGGIAAAPAGAWPGGNVLPTAVSLSSTSTLEPALAAIQGSADAGFLPNVSTAAGLLAPGTGAGYTGWLG